MKRRAAVTMALLVCSAIALAAGSSSAAAKSETSTVEVGGSVHRARVWLAVGDTLRMVLASGTRAGGRWSVANSGGDILVAEKGASRPSRQVFSFVAAKPGDAGLIFAKTGEPDRARTRTLKITVVPSGAASPAGIRPRGRLVAKFAGKIPCADCSGILETMAFYTARQDSGRGIYVDRMEYIGRSFTYIEAGRWLVQRGGTVEKPEMIYSLRGNDASSRWRKYRMDDRLLVPLDERGKPIQSPFNLSLHQIE